MDIFDYAGGVMLTIVIVSAVIAFSGSLGNADRVVERYRDDILRRTNGIV